MVWIKFIIATSLVWEWFNKWPHQKYSLQIFRIRNMKLSKYTIDHSYPFCSSRIPLCKRNEPSTLRPEWPWNRNLWKQERNHILIYLISFFCLKLCYYVKTSSSSSWINQSVRQNNWHVNYSCFFLTCHNTFLPTINKISQIPTWLPLFHTHPVSRSLE